MSKGNILEAAIRKCDTIYCFLPNPGPISNSQTISNKKEKKKGWDNVSRYAEVLQSFIFFFKKKKTNKQNKTRVKVVILHGEEGDLKKVLKKGLAISVLIRFYALFCQKKPPIFCFTVSCKRLRSRLLLTFF